MAYLGAEHEGRVEEWLMDANNTAQAIAHALSGGKKNVLRDYGRHLRKGASGGDSDNMSELRRRVHAMRRQGLVG